MTETLARSADPSQSAAAADLPSIGGRARIRVGIIGATGYAGGEMVRLLDLHPNVRVVGLQGRGREQEPVGTMHPHLARTGYHVDSTLPEADAVFLALPHGLAAAQARDLVASGATIIDQGPDFRLRDPADYPRWYGFEHPAPDLLARSVYGLPELHRDELAALGGSDVAIVGAPGCYPTATLLALAPLARAGLIADLVVDAKSGVSGAGREPKADLGFSEVNESVKAYGIGGHRHVAEMEQELALLSPSPDANPGVVTVDFLPHLIPMTRGILSAGPRTADPPRDHRRAARAVPRRVPRRAVRGGHRQRAGHQARDRQQPRARVRDAGRADRTHPGHRRRGQPGQGCRGTGDPGVQRGLRPARDGRAGAATARSLTVVSTPPGRPARIPRPTCPRSRTPLGSPGASVPAPRPRVSRSPAGRTCRSCSWTAAPVRVAATFTPNRFASAPVLLSRAHLATVDPGGAGRYATTAALLSVSGCANAATGAAGMADQRRLADVLGAAIGVPATHTIAVATGMIGPRYPMALHRAGPRRPRRRRPATTRTTPSLPWPRRSARPTPGPSGRPRARDCRAPMGRCARSRSPASPRAWA